MADEAEQTPALPALDSDPEDGLKIWRTRLSAIRLDYGRHSWAVPATRCRSGYERCKTHLEAFLAHIHFGELRCVATQCEFNYFGLRKVV
jgi:hypothetical protein